MSIDYDALETWASMAAQALQDVIDDAVESDSDKPSVEVATDLRALLDDLDRIMSGGGSLMTQLAAIKGDPGVHLKLDFEQSETV